MLHVLSINLFQNSMEMITVQITTTGKIKKYLSDHRHYHCVVKEVIGHILIVLYSDLDTEALV